MREAQLDMAEEFDLLIVIICSSCSVAERISEKQAGAEIVFMLLLYRPSNCVKTWVFSSGPNHVCYVVHFLVYSRAGHPPLAFPRVWWGVFRFRNTECSLQLKFDILLRKQVNRGTGNTKSRCGILGEGCQLQSK